MADFDLRRFMEKASWQTDANCRGLDPDIFMFVEDARNGIGLDKLRRAQEICRACDVQAECLAYALNNGEQGVWAGTTERARRLIRRRRQAQVTT